MMNKNYRSSGPKKFGNKYSHSRPGGNSSSTSGNGYSRSRYPRQSQGQKYKQKSWSVSELLRVVENMERNKQFQEEIPETPYVPAHKFADFALTGILKKNINDKGYREPTPIQDQSIPPLLEGKDLIGIANTGTGKTAAFLIPLIHKAYTNKNTKVLIVTPTRELAMQIYEEFRAFSVEMRIYAAVCIGGANIERQKQELRRNPAFVIGTPGRIKDLLKQKALDLSRFNNVVLDEADQMVDIGFVNEIKFFISLLPQQRQSLFFSATVSPKVSEILASFVKDPITVSVKKQETSSNVHQKVLKVERHEKKVDVLQGLLTSEGVTKALVFGSTKWGVQKLSEELITRGLKAGAIHGDKRQNQRLQTLRAFQKNEITVLLATNVAARGLDIKDVTHVINYDMPESYEDYVHRIGRTGRANKKGVAVTLVEDRY